MAPRARGDQIFDDAEMVDRLTRGRRRPRTVANILSAMLELDTFTGLELAARAGLRIEAWRKRWHEDPVWKRLVDDVDTLPTRGRSVEVKTLRAEWRPAVEEALRLLSAEAVPPAPIVIAEHPDCDRCADLLASIHRAPRPAFPEKLRRIAMAEDRLSQAWAECCGKAAAGTHTIAPSLKSTFAIRREQVNHRREMVLDECARFLTERSDILNELLRTGSHPLTESMEVRLCHAGAAAYAAMVLGGREPAVRVVRSGLIARDRTAFFDKVGAVIVLTVTTDLAVAGLDHDVARDWARHTGDFVQSLARQPDLRMEPAVADRCRDLARAVGCRPEIGVVLHEIANGARGGDDDLYDPADALGALAPAA